MIAQSDKNVLVDSPNTLEGLIRPSIRIAQLDILRGVAIFLVMGRHVELSEDRQGFFRPIAALWHNLGWSGVDLFFVLSGFLVGGLLFTELRRYGYIDIKRFLIRRGFKIWPGYFFYLFVLWLLNRLGIIHDAGNLIPNLMHLQNYLGSPRGHTWSLAVEEHFYLILPLVLWLLAAHIRKRGDIEKAIPGVVVFCLTGMVGCLLWRLSNLGQTVVDRNYYATHLRIDGLLCGVLLAYLYHYKPDVLTAIARYRKVLCGVGVALIVSLVGGDMQRPFVWTIGYTMVYLGYAALFLGLLYTPKDGGTLGRWIHHSLSARLLAFLGTYSYSIYLWHIDLGLKPVLIVLQSRFFFWLPTWSLWILCTVLGMLLACLAGILLGNLIEKPALAVRDRLMPGRARALGETR